MMPDQASDSSGNIIPFERPASAGTPSRLPVPGRQENTVRAYRLESSSDSTSGGDGGGYDLAVRVGVLEGQMIELQGTLKGVGRDVADIKAAVRHLATADEIGELKAKIKSIPTAVEQVIFFISVGVIFVAIYFGIR